MLFFRVVTQTQITLWQRCPCLVAGITLAGDRALTIERVKKDDEGLYECVATNVEGVARTSAVVTVIGRPLMPENMSAIQKNAVTQQPSLQLQKSRRLCPSPSPLQVALFRTSEAKSPSGAGKNLWLPGMQSTFLSRLLWCRLWLRVCTSRTWPLGSVKRSTNECKETACYDTRGGRKHTPQMMVLPASCTHIFVPCR